MTAAEFHERILSLLRRDPFEPFDIELTDGRRLHVIDPEMVATSGGKGVYGGHTGEIVIFDYSITRRLGAEAPSPTA